MAEQHLPTPVDLSGPTLLLGVPGDVHLLDLRGVETDLAGRWVAESPAGVPVGVRVLDPTAVAAAMEVGATLVHVDVALAGAAEVLEAARSGAVVVVGGELEVAQRAARTLLDGGARPEHVVVELEASPATVATLPAGVRAAEAAGLGVGAVVAPGGGPAAEVLGWELGVLTRLLALRVRTVRGVPLHRFRRVRAVVEAVAAAAPLGAPGAGVGR
ncbi:MAG TPA: hypothetical protein VHK88_06065 [Aquihabitans sp.]|nr:hypothetical protein [Aquihabitans sp.]